MWPFGGEHDEVAGILGPAALPWLEGAEIAAWTPDPNFKAQSYFVVRTMSEAEFRSWAAAVRLQVSEAPSIPSGVFATPDGVTLTRWITGPTPDASSLDAQGDTDRAAIWSRWQEGVGFTVIHPAY